MVINFQVILRLTTWLWLICIDRKSFYNFIYLINGSNKKMGFPLWNSWNTGRVYREITRWAEKFKTNEDKLPDSDAHSKSGEQTKISCLKKELISKYILITGSDRRWKIFFDIQKTSFVFILLAYLNVINEILLQ